MSGTQDLVVVAGVENMAVVPFDANSAVSERFGAPRGGMGWLERYGKEEISQFRGAELIAQKWKLSREEMEQYALDSHRRAVRAIDAGYFASQTEPLADLTADEGPRRETSLGQMAKRPPLREGWDLTAALASQISVGAAALLIASEAALRTHGLTPIARVHAMSVVGDDPVYMLTGPIRATARVLDHAGLKIEDIDTFEINEAFASVVLAWLRETGAAMERTNPNGGAIALGHPVGATGAILAAKLIHELRRTGGKHGLQSMCEGGGQANATIIERL
jgi:acetyl-CoA C-acetyltransferase